MRVKVSRARLAQDWLLITRAAETGAGAKPQSAVGLVFSLIECYGQGVACSSLSPPESLMHPIMNHCHATPPQAVLYIDDG